MRTGLAFDGLQSIMGSIQGFWGMFWLQCKGQLQKDQGMLRIQARGLESRPGRAAGQALGGDLGSHIHWTHWIDGQGG